jgi:hypothetical protein
MSVRRIARLGARTLTLSALALTGFAGLGTTAANAAGVINCTAAGTVHYQTVGAITSWTLDGTGSCLGDFQGTYALAFTGVGTSSSVGACDANTPGPLSNLSLKIDGTITNVATHFPKVLNQTWVAGATTFPVSTPFEADTAGNAVGAGTIFTRIFGKCQPSGSPVAEYSFSFNS